MPKVHRYVRTKKAPSHHVLVSMMKRFFEVERWPPRKTLANMIVQIQDQITTQANVAKPTRISDGRAARIRVENSSNSIALPSALRLLKAVYVQPIANSPGIRDTHRMTLSCTLVPFHAPL